MAVNAQMRGYTGDLTEALNREERRITDGRRERGKKKHKPSTSEIFILSILAVTSFDFRLVRTCVYHSYI
jgi:hypothetical protein